MPDKGIDDLTAGQRIMTHVEQLAGKEMAGRRVGSRGEAGAALYLARHLKKAGLCPAGDAGTFFQAFPVCKYEPVLADKRMTLRQSSAEPAGFSENVLAALPGKTGEVIIVSAHYDHLGIVEGNLYPGASDNASGAAVVLELALALREEKPKYTILFAFWGGEEAGLLGSDHFSETPTVAPEKISALVNLDSIGNLGPDKKLLGWKAGENEVSAEILNKLAQQGWEVSWEKGNGHKSDEASFAQKGMAGFTLLSPNWLVDNHTPRDTADRVQTGYLVELLEAIRIALLT
ncbi:MAG: M20/M25/M40 family metallo-hydrolase [Peptococcaceae bacterium]|nr:M20/M25/M40 family metallo-hydrolase [Peptococcaceae bacterium]